MHDCSHISYTNRTCLLDGQLDHDMVASLVEVLDNI